jgi:sarcosine oxidase
VSARADVAVIGLGAMGSAALLTLARRGVTALGLDQFRPPHAFGSTHGRSRVIREAYYESPAYVPLVRRAAELWEALERDGGRPLLRRTGGLMLGPPGCQLVNGSRESAQAHGVPFELIEAAELRRRFPVFRAEGATVGLLEQRAGFLDPEACVETALRLAVQAGATLRLDTPVGGWRRSRDGLILSTPAGPVECGAAILAAGAWAAPRLAGAGIPLTVERQVMFWFQPREHPERFGPDRMPIFIWEWTPGRLFYGIPDHGAGIKVARHHEGVPVDPEGARMPVGEEEIAGMRATLRTTMPDAEGALRDAVTCLYTNTPDQHFVLGVHPEEPRLIIASPCSGHGFKFATAIGEIVADLATVGSSRFDLTPFRPDRFSVE